MVSELKQAGWVRGLGRWGRSRDRRAALLALIVVLALGTVFRFANLDKKVYWGDETFSSMRIAGYTLAEVTQELFDGQIRTGDELQHYQQPNPERGAGDTIRALAIDDPQHPPFYYLMARAWEQIFGSAVAVRRVLPVLFGLALIPVMGGLAWELFGTVPTAGLTMAIAALSPFHILYAQEVREYSLWALMIAGTSWLLLRAWRRNTWRDWGGYAIALILMLYTHLFSVLVAASFGVYGLVRWGVERQRSPFVRFLIASIAAGVAFLPWLKIALLNSSVVERTNEFTAEPVPLPILAWNWALNLARLWIDWDPQGRVIALHPRFPHGLEHLLQGGIIVGVALGTGFAIGDMVRRYPMRVWGLVLALMGGQGLTLIGMDLVAGGFRSAIARYLVPCYLGLQLAMAAFLGQRMGQSRRWRGAIAVALSVGMVSGAIALPARTWWTKQGSFDNPAVAAAITTSDQPLIVATFYLPRLLSLSYELPPQTRYQLAAEPLITDLPTAALDVFLYRPSQELRDRLAADPRYHLEPAYQSPPLYTYLPPVSRHAELWIDRLYPQTPVPTTLPNNP